MFEGDWVFEGGWVFEDDSCFLHLVVVLSVLSLSLTKTLCSVVTVAITATSKN